MTFVKADVAERERHLAMLLGGAMEQVRRRILERDWDGLRPSHFRVISLVPPEGISVTDLAERVGMTKQGCGQFVTQLVTTGHLAVAPDPDDGRVRLVRRTPLGERNVDEVIAINADLEAAWRERVGERRWATFRAVLEQVALGADRNA